MTEVITRFNLRLAPAEMAQTTRAAKLRGLSPAIFAVDAAVREADSVIAAELGI